MGKDGEFNRPEKTVPLTPREIQRTARLFQKQQEETRELQKDSRMQSVLTAAQQRLLENMRKSGHINVGTILELGKDWIPEDIKLDNSSRLPEFGDISLEVEFKEEIARGGQGSIRSAVDRKLRRNVAVKSLLPEFLEQNSIRNAFVEEARVTSQLDHPSIIPVYGIFDDKNHGLHLLMKQVHGGTFKEYLHQTCIIYDVLKKRQICQSERRLLQQRLDIFQRVCEAISYAHHQKVIHRDLKPENIMIGAFGEPYVMDWGIAEFQSKQQLNRANNQVRGTLRYIAPEILDLQPYDSRSDIYSLGVILYELVFLKPAYKTESEKEILGAARKSEFDSFNHRYGCQVDQDLKMIIRKATARKPKYRYSNVRALLEDLSSYRRFEEVSANPDSTLRSAMRFLNRNPTLIFYLCVFLLVLFSGMLILLFYSLMNTSVWAAHMVGAAALLRPEHSVEKR